MTGRILCDLMLVLFSFFLETCGRHKYTCICMHAFCFFEKKHREHVFSIDLLEILKDSYRLRCIRYIHSDLIISDLDDVLRCSLPYICALYTYLSHIRLRVCIPL